MSKIAVGAYSALPSPRFLWSILEPVTADRKGTKGERKKGEKNDEGEKREVGEKTCKDPWPSVLQPLNPGYATAQNS